MDVLTARPNTMAFIEQVALKYGIKKYKIQNVGTNEKGEGYQGEIFMVDLVDEAQGKTLNLIIKAAFVDNNARQVAPIHNSYENEIYFYTTLYPAFKKCEKTPKMELIPNFFLAQLNEPSEVLALENLKQRGFKVMPKAETLDDHHVRLIMKAYGQLHAYSFIVKAQQPALYQNLCGKLHNIWAKLMASSLFSNSFQGVVQLLYERLTPGEDDQIIGELEKYRGEGGTDIFRESYTKEGAFSVILHGDCWPNNMMFKYEGDDGTGKPCDVRLLDFQLIKVGSPVCDLSYCLYSGGSKIIYDHLDDYLTVYIESLSSCIRDWNGDPEQIFSLEDLRNEWRFFSKFGFLISIVLLRMRLTIQEDQIHFTDEQLVDCDDAFANRKFDEDAFTKKAREILEHVSKIGVL